MSEKKTLSDYVTTTTLRERLLPPSERARLKAMWGDVPFVWRIQIPAPNTVKWRWRNYEWPGDRPWEWDITMDCQIYRHSRYMNTCRVCGHNHELPRETDRRYAFRWYPMKPSVKSLQQWERWRRYREMAEAVASGRGHDL